MTKLLIKYQDKYICEQNRNEIDFIHIPNYHINNEPFSNISIIITLMFTSNLKSDYSSKVTLSNIEWSDLFEEYFLPEYLFQVDEDTYVYNLDNLLKDYPEYLNHYQNTLTNLPYNIIIRTKEELVNIPKEELPNEEIPYAWDFNTTYTNKELEQFIKTQNTTIGKNDVLLLYSGGKDSTLSAIRLYNAGYNIHFIHFDNGHMRDQDKPYLTFKKTFQNKEGFYFDYELSSTDIKSIFEEYFNKWSNEVEKNPDNISLISEIRCLSCRMAMYTKAIEIAKSRGFKYIAEGARISQKFMLEQLPIISRLKDLTESHQIKLLLPVLYLEDDLKEIEELLSNGYSSKTWESKCLIGREAKDKTPEEEQTIVDYYDTILKPSIIKRIK